jgi:AraC-like DNA-binding protein
MDIIFTIGIFLAFFLQFLLLSKKQKSVSDRVLAVWMFFIGVHLFSYYIYHQGYWDKYPHLVGITHPFPLLHGPMLFLYTVFSLRDDQHFRWKDYLHFAPAIFAYLYMVRFFFFYSVEQKVLVNSGEVDDFGLFMNLSLVAFIISGIVYPIISYRLVGKHHRLITQNFSYEENISLNWLRYCIGGIWTIYLTVGAITVAKEVIGYQFGFNADLIFYSLIMLFVFLIGYFGIRHQGIFAENTATGKTLAEPKAMGEYKKSGLKQDEAELLHQKLLELMKVQKPFLEPKLTLNILASELNVSINYISQIINQYQGRNFYDFVNEYRVNEFKERLSNPKNKNFNILALALDSGFNSKSSFNQVFKKHTAQTPSQYMAGLKS